MFKFAARIIATIIAAPFIVLGLVLSYSGEYIEKAGELILEKMTIIARNFNSVLRSFDD